MIKKSLATQHSKATKAAAPSDPAAAEGLLDTVQQALADLEGAAAALEEGRELVRVSTQLV